MIVEFDGDIPVAIGQFIAGAEIPPELAGVDWQHLRLVGGRVVDGSQFGAFYVDSFGRKHAERQRGLPLVHCRISDTLVRDEAGAWRVQTSAEWHAADAAGRWARVRARRNALLAESDWTQLPDVRLGAVAKREWADYRQELRDITRQPDPDAVTWPMRPGGDHG